ncbi:uncharacterized protein LOC125237715 [Leguminivora glycinivorella]|uniref:uncharacterized protein LOC125237715 n=1 Tax=Leguminivora glycinivorella TaxID=1035111 RepID=UPI00200C77C8|nr:uncharacterized protein LOC125237715 [Leguminivora glycinivorella]
MPPTTIVCAGCGNPFPKRNEYLACSLCKLKYDLTCANIDIKTFGAMSTQHKGQWKCQECCCKQPKTDNTNTPVRLAAASVAGAPTGSCTETLKAEINAKQKKQSAALAPAAEPNCKLGEDEKCPDPLASLTAEIQLMRADMGKMNLSLQNMNSTLNKCNERLADLEQRLAQSDNRVRALEEREGENDILRQRIIQLEDQLNVQAQASLSNEMEIIGVNELPNENRTHIVLTAAIKMGLNLTESDIDSVTRVGPRGAKLPELDTKLPRPLVVKFVRRAKRNEFLKAAKSRRNIDTNAIEISGPKRKVFFNERLTKANRELFRNSRSQSSRLDTSSVGPEMVLFSFARRMVALKSQFEALQIWTVIWDRPWMKCLPPPSNSWAPTPRISYCKTLILPVISSTSQLKFVCSNPNFITHTSHTHNHTPYK